MVFIDHKPLVYLFSWPLLNLCQIHWVEKLVEFYLEVHYIAGHTNVVANGLSQAPVITELHLVSDPTMH